MSLSLLGKILNSLGTMRRYKNGDGEGFVWRWWNPISWPLSIIVFILDGLFQGFPGAWRNRHDIGWRMNPWFVEHPEQLEWIKGKKHG